MIYLEPHTILTLKGDAREVRLSYVFEDDGGCRKGLTVSRIMPGSKPVSYGTDGSPTPRAKVLAGGEVVGVLDPHLSSEDDSDEILDQRPRALLGSGAATCAFTILDGVEVGPEFEPRPIFDALRQNGFGEQTAHILGDGYVGTMTDYLRYSEWGERSIYPLLALSRSDADLAGVPPVTRNGATVVTGDGALIGIVVGSYDDGKFYAVVPMRDALDWHRLRMAPRRQPTRDDALLRALDVSSAGPR